MNCAGHGDSVIDKLGMIVSKLPYKRVYLSTDLKSSTYITRDEMDIVIRFLDVLYANAKTAVLALDGMTGVAKDSDKIVDWTKTTKCSFGNLTLSNISDEFALKFISVLDPIIPLVITQCVFKDESDAIRKTLELIEATQKKNIIIASMPVQHLLGLNNTTITSVTRFARRLWTYTTPRFKLSLYSFHYNLIEFANLSIWANNPFPNLALINEAIAFDEFNRPLPASASPNLNRMFCFKTIRHSTAYTASQTDYYMQKMLKSIRSTMEEEPSYQIYHNLTSIEIWLCYNNTKGVVGLVLTIIQFITQIYPTITHITIDNAAVTNHTAQVLERELDIQWNCQKTRKDPSNLPKIKISLHNKTCNAYFSYQINHHYTNQHVVESIVEITPIPNYRLFPPTN
ncbi:hypothetical protein NEHOM01_2150 [Nematocida homosporus]|uniref:uncharacterized protein n=1 Tax=Nematocida homosporus TaxID=1912981 RepID=UPI00221FD036|nr:uncharacterized protein NEHOM01_2150 [Nematocida homosporus]KAI5187400.1 hypothetical protein NEHOM01_2150 [Nematocida homosporus]